MAKRTNPRKARGASSKPTDPSRIAALMADRLFDHHLSDLMGVLDLANENDGPHGETNDGLYERLVEAVDPKKARYPQAAHTRVAEALAADQRRDFIAVTDWLEKDMDTRAEAAYLVGLAVGRRLGGAR